MDVMNLVARLTLNTASYTAGMNAARKQMTDTAKETQKTAKSVNEVGTAYNNTGKFAEKFSISEKARITILTRSKAKMDEIAKAQRIERELFEQGKIGLDEYMADMSKMSKEYDQATISMKNFSSQIADGGSGASLSSSGASFAKAAAIILMAVRLLTKAVKSFNETAKNAESNSFDLSTSARKTGFTTQQLQEWKGIIAESGGKSEGLVSAITSSQEFVAAAQSGNYEESSALSRLGLNASSLSKMSKSAQFRAIIERLQRVSNSSERAKLAEQIFGSGVYESILPLIDSGGDINSYLDAAYKDALIASDETIAQALEHNTAANVADLASLTGKTTRGANSWVRNYWVGLKKSWAQDTQWVHNPASGEAGWSINPSDYGASSIMNESAYVEGVVNGIAGANAMNGMNGGNVTVNVRIGEKEIKDMTYEAFNDGAADRGYKSYGKVGAN